ncbi:MAG: hypothetical protein IT423_14150 [Pirellulaceae bacterium]|nr:hypothetical protein [Pirellulaceae bacterium]
MQTRLSQPILWVVLATAQWTSGAIHGQFIVPATPLQLDTPPASLEQPNMAEAPPVAELGRADSQVQTAQQISVSESVARPMIVPASAQESRPQPPVQKDERPSNNYLPPQLPIGRINIGVQAKPFKGNGDKPKDQSQAALGDLPSVTAASAEQWPWTMGTNARPTAADVMYRPLYFEEVNLERYGRSRGPLQPAVSAARFFGTIPALPYAMTVRHPGQVNYWRWPYPSGWMAPRVRELPPLEPGAAIVEASAVTGMFFLVP